MSKRLSELHDNDYELTGDELVEIAVPSEDSATGYRSTAVEVSKIGGGGGLSNRIRFNYSGAVGLSGFETNTGLNWGSETDTVVIGIPLQQFRANGVLVRANEGKVVTEQEAFDYADSNNIRSATFRLMGNFSAHVVNAVADPSEWDFQNNPYYNYDIRPDAVANNLPDTFGYIDANVTFGDNTGDGMVVGIKNHINLMDSTVVDGGTSTVSSSLDTMIADVVTSYAESSSTSDSTDESRPIHYAQARVVGAWTDERYNWDIDSDERFVMFRLRIEPMDISSENDMQFAILYVQVSGHIDYEILTASKYTSFT